MKLGAAGSASCALVRYSGTIENASRSTSGWRVQSTLQSTGVNSHLCGLTTTESASSAPSSTQRSSGTRAALPAYAASTCSQRRCSAQTAAIVATGSTLVLDVVPIVATTAAGDVRQSIALALSVAASISPRIPGAEAVDAKYAMKPGACQCVLAGMSRRSTSVSTASKSSCDSGGAGGSDPRSAPGATRGSTGRSASDPR